MKTACLGFAALCSVVISLLAGCASQPLSETSIPLDTKKERHVTLSARYMLIRGGMPEAKGDLAFLDRNGDVEPRVLTSRQVDTALAELRRLTGQEVHSTRNLLIAVSEDLEAMRSKVPLLRHPDRGHEPPITISGQVFTVRPDFAVDLELSSHAHGNTVYMRVELRGTNFDGWVEYGASSAKLSASPDGAEDQHANVTEVPMPSAFFQPIFSENLLMRETLLTSGQTLVLRSGRRIPEPSHGVKDTVSEPSAASDVENIVVFLTATVEPLDR